MFKFTKSLAAAAVALASVGLAYAPSVVAAPAAAVPAVLTQQGRLLDDTGAPVNTSTSFKFAIYAAATGGNAIWSETQTITPDQGYFSARLGEDLANLFSKTNVFDGTQGTLYLGIQIGADTAELAPRQQLTSVPFALIANRALTADHATLADSATTTPNADHATNADTATSVKSISALITSAQVSGTGSATYVVANCPANTSITGGSCLQQLGAVAAVGYQSGKGAGTGWICQCANTSSTQCTSVVSTVYCAK